MPKELAVCSTSSARNNAHSWSDKVPITAARVLIGVFFCISGGTKLFVPAQFDEMQQTMIHSHIPFPHSSALLVSLVEFACGGGLVLGLLAPLSAVVLLGGHDRRHSHQPDRKHTRGGFLAWLDGFLYLPEVLYVLILLWLLFSGPGRYSVDGIISSLDVSP